MNHRDLQDREELHSYADQRPGETLAEYDERRADENQAAADRLPMVEAALTQCQHIAHNESVEIERAMSAPAGRLTKDELRALTRKGLVALNLINSIAEGGEATPEFAAMLAAEQAGDRDAGSDS